MTSRDAVLRLTPVTLAHAPALQVLFEDPAVVEHLTFPSPYPPGEMEKYIADAIREREHGRKFVFAIVEPDGRSSGIALLKGVDVVAGVGEVGYALGRAYWGGGRATQAADAMLAFGFDTLGLTLIHAVCTVANTASLRVLEKLGFTEDERRDEYQDRWGEARPQIRASVTASRWRQARRSVKGTATIT